MEDDTMRLLSEIGDWEAHPPGTLATRDARIAELERERDALAARISELEEHYEATRELSIARGRNLLESRREIRKLRDRISGLESCGDGADISTSDLGHPTDEMKLTIEDCKWAEEHAREEAHDANFEGNFDACVDAEDRADRFEAHAKYLESKSAE